MSKTENQDSENSFWSGVLEMVGAFGMCALIIFLLYVGFIEIKELVNFLWKEISPYIQ